ncbi:GNAT family N-acetyltransferase [Radicibacter daui]|uniref:GNAT family N-acetyltransferase n=1 Tax=Radicibacter daui TaxID=3064829 RepID=UPI0040468BF6
MSTVLSSIALRPAGTADTSAIAALHAASWKLAYRGLVSDGFLDEGLEEGRLAHWLVRMATLPAEDLVMLAEDPQASMLAGFVYVMVAGQPEGHAYVDNLHAAPMLKGRGIGRRLMAAAALHAMAAGCHTLSLTVLEGNLAARAFYDRLGGMTQPIGEFSFGGAMVPECRVSWPDLKALLAACGKQGMDAAQAAGASTDFGSR